MIGGYEKGWFRDTFNKWVARHRKCVNCDGEYFEKMWRKRRVIDEIDVKLPRMGVSCYTCFIVIFL